MRRNGEFYAECTLKFLEIDGDDEESAGAQTALYALDVVRVLKRGAPVVRARKGVCDVDLGQDGVQPGFPAAEAGDFAVVFKVGDPEDISFLQGSFELKPLK